ncbi:dTDP-4-dehydrorhamnose 3,5-epimerase [Alsobacter sp. SYSU M60028]|uniref:dTDP-4-dehydrorhamnose 3,5-epimerase n=1 Tax=Alsobacter ponti TaxID=2962936 RepID=A0ABT1LF27_9HYPH|nr:dTDP-4-dehydrorhamnose 3,5-epimerase [Alsobacter ponti]MCP8940097.1 dTDP-4-dehydrorhamnose 3,5-epimerase [Alsobacter ponti]
MKLVPTELPGVMVVEAEPVGDERGLFARVYDADAFAAAGLPTDWPQCNLSWNPVRHTLRGMHFQTGEAAEPKLVRCTRGRVFDVAVDLRPASPGFRRWVGVELDADRRNALYVPPGCAHGFLTLTQEAEVLYMMGARYRPEAASGVRWNDPAFAIAWPAAPALIGPRDASWPDFG